MIPQHRGRDGRPLDSTDGADDPSFRDVPIKWWHVVIFGSIGACIGIAFALLVLSVLP